MPLRLHKMTPSQSPSLQGIIKYAVLQVAELFVLVIALLFVGRWIHIPRWLFWTLLLGWAIKDAAMYPIVWRAYEANNQQELSPVVGDFATAQQDLSPSGYVRINGELWRAITENPDTSIRKGQKVLVIEVRGSLLVVTEV